MIHIGEKIKARAKELKVGPSELGAMVNTTKQNITSIYTRSSIDSELLWQLSKALKQNFFLFYELSNLEDNAKQKLLLQMDEIKKENATLKKEMKSLKEKYDLLEKINALLEKSGNRK